MTSLNRARGMRVNMLTSLSRVRDAYRLYDKIWDEHRDRVRQELKYAPGATLQPHHDKLAEQRADQDPLTLEALADVAKHQPLATLYALAYLVEVDYGWRFDGDDGRDL